MSLPVLKKIYLLQMYNKPFMFFYFVCNYVVIHTTSGSFFKDSFGIKIVEQRKSSNII